MNPVSSAPLGSLTSLKCGGVAELLYTPASMQDVIDILAQTTPEEPLWMLGYGSNCLISDQGLPGKTILWRNGEIFRDGTLLVVDAGVWWDEFVRYAIEQNLWGVELMSEIPSSVGGAIFGNIAAYGQQVSDTLLWVDVYNRQTGSTERLERSAVEFAYRESSLQTSPHLIILQAAFQLSTTPLHTLRYESALRIAAELGRNVNDLAQVREVIIETRARAGSLYDPNNPHAERTAGSFFKNPLVTAEQAVMLASYDETGKTLERIKEQNEIHGGSAQRASAAHVLLAAGYTRGHSWGTVKLHDKHVLKLETLEGATAQDVYRAATEIITTVHNELHITLTPEVRFLGKFA